MFEFGADLFRAEVEVAPLIGNPKLIIVDEPTAGLDPVERRRFQNLLTQFSDNQVILLSTHIVEDVADLCPRMALLAAGRVLLQGEPESLTNALTGKIWRRQINHDELTTLRSCARVLSTRNRGGRLEARLFSESAPDGATTTSPTLEDVYLCALGDAGIDIGLDQ